MKVTEFKELYYTDFNIHRLFSMDQHWADGSEFAMNRTRKTSALFRLKDSCADYLLPSGELLRFPRGSILYIPQNSVYKTRFYACSGQTAHTQLIEFELLDPAGMPFICGDRIIAVAHDENEYYRDLFEDAVKVYDKFNYSYAEFKAILYSLLAGISKHFQKEKIYSKEFYAIAPAINYLNRNPHAVVSVEELAKLCHVSESCFRTLFKRYSGMTPSDYCQDKRMRRAKKLLQSNMYSVGEVAAMLGYTDAGYFSKVFKKTVGESPKEFMQRS